MAIYLPIFLNEVDFIKKLTYINAINKGITFMNFLDHPFFGYGETQAQAAHIIRLTSVLYLIVGVGMLLGFVIFYKQIRATKSWLRYNLWLVILYIGIGINQYYTPDTPMKYIGIVIIFSLLYTTVKSLKMISPITMKPMETKKWKKAEKIFKAMGPEAEAQYLNSIAAALVLNSFIIWFALFYVSLISIRADLILREYDMKIGI